MMEELDGRESHQKIWRASQRPPSKGKRIRIWRYFGTVLHPTLTTIITFRMFVCRHSLLISGDFNLLSPASDYRRVFFCGIAAKSANRRIGYSS
jgi:hypothetical protein